MDQVFEIADSWGDCPRQIIIVEFQLCYAATRNSYSKPGVYRPGKLVCIIGPAFTACAVIERYQGQGVLLQHLGAGRGEQAQNIHKCDTIRGDLLESCVEYKVFLKDVQKRY